MIVLLTGAPGAGKGTQSEKLAAEHGALCLSTGDLIRKQIKSGSPLGLKVKEIVESGRLVDDVMMLDVIENHFRDIPSKSVVILDGYPRNLKQAGDLKRLDKSHPVVAVLHIDLDMEELVKRISGRRVCNGCGATYNLYFLKPKVEGQCDRCGGNDLVHRKDDQEDRVRVRMEIFKNETDEIHAFYDKQGIYKRISGKGEPVDVFQRLNREWIDRVVPRI